MKGVCGWSGVISRGAEVEKAQGDEDYYTRRNTGSSTSMCGAGLSKGKEEHLQRAARHPPHCAVLTHHTPPASTLDGAMSQMTPPLPSSPSSRASVHTPLGQGRALAEPGLVAWDLVPVETAACELLPVTPILQLQRVWLLCSAGRCGRGAERGRHCPPSHQ